MSEVPPKTTCKHGHPLTAENVVVRRSRGREFRACRICKRGDNQRYQRRYRAPAGQKVAHRLIDFALRMGRIQKEPCRVCGSDQVHAHHPRGYLGDAAYDIWWLCPVHHVAAHRESGSVRP